MQLKDYVYKHESSLRDRAVCLLLTKDKFLIGEKKEGFGAGKLVAPGGKAEQGETLDQTVIREVDEEIGVKANRVQLHAVLEYYFPKVEQSQRVNFYICTKWEGEPTESDELKPSWFDKDKIPFEKTWADYPYWFEHLVGEKFINGSFLYNELNEVEECNLHISENNIF